MWVLYSPRKIATASFRKLPSLADKKNDMLTKMKYVSTNLLTNYFLLDFGSFLIAFLKLVTAILDHHFTSSEWPKLFSYAFASFF